MRAAVAALMVIAGFLLVAGILSLGMTSKSAADRDFIQYWAAGRQIVHGANPYDGVAILRLENQAGSDDDEPRIAANPPIALFLALPLGLVSAKTGAILWTLALLASISVANWILWMLNGRPDSRFHLFGYLFAPVVACQMAGQIGTFLLLAVVLFLFFHRTRPLLAGAVLLPCALKPHLFLPFAVVLVLWALDRKAYRILAGFAATLLASCAISLYLDPQAWSQYSRTMGGSGLMRVFVPTLSVALRFLIDRNALWLQFVPEACACVWAVWYYATRRSRWSWTDQGLLLLLVSAACTPYAWFTDEAVALPAVLAGLYRAIGFKRSPWPIALIAGIALIEVLAEVKLISLYYLWTAPAWLIWYLYATAGGSIHVESAEVQKESTEEKECPAQARP